MSNIIPDGDFIMKHAQFQDHNVDPNANYHENRNLLVRSLTASPCSSRTFDNNFKFAACLRARGGLPHQILGGRVCGKRPNTSQEDIP